MKNLVSLNQLEKAIEKTPDYEVPASPMPEPGEKKYNNQISSLYVLHTTDYKEEEGIIYIPLYMAPCL